MPELLTRPGFWLAAYLAVMNLAAFGAYGADKHRARARELAHPGADAVSAAPAGRQRGRAAGHACVPPQDPALVFPLGNSRYFPSPTGCLRRRMVPGQVIYPFFLPQGAVIFPIAAPCNFSGQSIGCASLSKIFFDKLQGLFRPFIKVLKRR